MKLIEKLVERSKLGIKQSLYFARALHMVPPEYSRMPLVEDALQDEATLW